MTYETFVKNMIEQFPFLKEECLVYMDDDDPLPYVAVGAVFIPWLEACLKAQDVSKVAKACDFIEVAAAEGQADSRLADLIGIEIGEWLPEVLDRHLLLSHFGPHTERACHYHIIRLSS
jgi:hypothetical protein